MGNNTSRNTPSNLKLESQKIMELTGRSEDWQKWKTRTQCALDGSGYEGILNYSNYAFRHLDMSCIVYSQLLVATLGGTAHHLVKQFKKEKDENKAWNALLEWYDGD
eukprot:11551599-Ditylum_brightwellii.AAC.1